MGKGHKQFPLTTKENCKIYLCRIISTCELCMDKLKEYDAEGKAVLEQYKGESKIPYSLYGSICDKSYNTLDYLLNILGDAQTSSISYFKYRAQIQRQNKRGNMTVTLTAMDTDMEELLSQFNRMRNFQNHIPESILIAEVDAINSGEMMLPMDPVEILHYNFVTYEYFEHLYLSNEEFYNNARKIIQIAKKDYSLLMGKTIAYPRSYTDVPLGVEKATPVNKAATFQGIHNAETGR